MILLFIPAFFLLLFGYALNFDIKHVALAVPGSRRQRREPRARVGVPELGLFRPGGDHPVAAGTPTGDGLGRGQGRAIIPENTGRAVRRGQLAPVQVIINGDNATTAATVLGYVMTIVQSVSSSFIVERLGLNLTPPVRVEPRIWFNPELKSALFFVPGLIGFIGMIVDRDLDRAVGRPGEGAGHLGAGADGANQHGVLRGREDPSLPGAVAGLGDVGGRRPRCGSSSCRCAGRGDRCCSRPRCSCSARSARGCWCPPSPNPSWWHSKSP